MIALASDRLPSATSAKGRRVTFERMVTGAIVANAAVFVWGLADHRHAEQADLVEHLIVAVFIAEMAIKIWTQRLSWFRRPWNIFDAAVITLSLMPMLPGAAVLRLVRLARLAKLLHLLRHVSHLRLAKLLFARGAVSST